MEVQGRGATRPGDDAAGPGCQRSDSRQRRLPAEGSRRLPAALLEPLAVNRLVCSRAAASPRCDAEAVAFPQHFRSTWDPAVEPPVPLPVFPDEAAFADAACERLSRWFHVDREVPGRHCSGRSLRIDAVISPIDPAGWRDAHPCFGVEFKIAGQRTFDTRNFTGWAAQAVDYTHVEWQRYGRLHVLVCPGLTSHLDTYGEPATRLLSKMLWQLGVGELQPIRHHGWAIIAQARHILWSQNAGVKEGARWSVDRRAGHR